MRNTSVCLSAGNIVCAHLKRFYLGNTAEHMEQEEEVEDVSLK